MWTLHLFLALLASSGHAYRPLRPQVHSSQPLKQIKEDALFLTPYIESDDVATGRDLARVVLPLDGLNDGEQPESFAGFITVDKAYDSNMFFWFVPATDVDPLTAPVVIWLQGGPGASSLFGLLELHGPFQSVFDGNNNVVAKPNEHAWTKVANVIYIDNPVGAGFSFTNKLPTTEEEVADDLYEFLIQWFTLFPMYQDNPFYPFGESYAGKFVPRISKKIHDENPTASLKINLAGLGIGDGFMSPEDSSVYAEFLYQTSLVGEVERDDLLEIEQEMKSYCAKGQYYNAWQEWSRELDYFLSSMNCGYYYGIDLCDVPAEEDNYEDFVRLPSTRAAIHVGNTFFGQDSGSVYYSMINVFMASERETVEFLLERYPVLLYNGNFDIICNHSGVLKMIEAMTSWSGKDKYYRTKRSAYNVGSETAGYLKSVDNLRLFAMRNAGHMVPRSQPKYSLQMFKDFISGRL